MTIDIRQSKEYANHLRNLGWTVERIASVNYFVKKVPLLGSFLKIQRPEKIDLNTIGILGRKYKIRRIIIEPKRISDTKRLVSGGYRLAKSTYLPSKTLVLRLKNKKIIYNSFKKNTKYGIKRSASLPILQNPKLSTFHDSWKNVAGFSHYVPSIGTLESLQTTLGTNMLILASHNNMSRKIMYNAGSIFLLSDDTCYYWQSFSDKIGRSSLAQYSILWNGILWGISRGAKYFDFEGIYDFRFPNKSWLGFTFFKKQFGGTEIEYPGTYYRNIFRFL